MSLKPESEEVLTTTAKQNSQWRKYGKRTQESTEQAPNGQSCKILSNEIIQSINKYPQVNSEINK